MYWDELEDRTETLTSYPLVMTNSSPWYRWPIEVDGLPIKNGSMVLVC